MLNVTVELNKGSTLKDDLDCQHVCLSVVLNEIFAYNSIHDVLSSVCNTSITVPCVAV